MIFRDKVHSISCVIPPLLSGGIMLSYRCTNACRHCLYRCSPTRPDEWMTLEMAGKVFNALSKEPQLHSIHLAGGEATLRFDLLVETVKLARSYRLPLAYLETNASWCGDREETREKLKGLKEAGLPAILVSASMFHNEFVPFSHMRNCVEIGQEVFGRGGVIVWLPHLYEALSQMPGEDRVHSLKEFCEFFNLSEWDRQLPLLYQIVAGGRAPQALRKCYRTVKAKSFEGLDCRGELLSTTHFHIDLYGNLFTGLCAGLATGSVGNLHPEIDEENHPVLDLLCKSGPFGLMKMAEEKNGFKQRSEGYVSKCDLCYDVRRCLFKEGEYTELRPEDYYSN